uniref:Uncharacterized protein LOC117364266 n=1 Tax=Geotrypetes seraphini TaxID=260995 RepID=A0A6P8RUI6_GEOSA|nr:uncharacterized protein LOC117364266 [Geotrypetes seraphini]XP_033809181.1 uncharacterized protein LOC117364266 [Geotrypetes seraphini]XP_033809182.1 uncharacterized protein LOC117364266 [Geotrypetes seraphini]XP_033809184.1 uncharacterized protein LOC117364266 [Geotrypetes seraphini]
MQAAMEKSKIPVWVHQGSMQSGKDFITDTNLPCPKKICPSNPGLPLFSKDPNINFAAKDSVNGVFKATSQRSSLASKRTGVSNRGIIARNRAEAELRDKNKHLEAQNSSLHADLSRAQETIKGLKESHEILERVVKELNERLERNMIILENSNIDPETGNRIVESVNERDRCQAEAKLLRENLLEELKSFSEMAAEKTMELQEAKCKWQAAEEMGQRFLEEYEAFQEEMEQYQQVLMQAEHQLGHNG